VIKSFLFVFDSIQISRKLVTKRLDRMPSIVNWYAFLENAICLASDDDAKQISAIIREAFPDLRFLVTEVDPKTKSGWLSRSVWAFLKNPQPVDTAADA
jgi:hypothetical protein